MQKIVKIAIFVFMIILLFQMVPSLIKTIKKEYSNYAEPKTKVGLVCIKSEINNVNRYIKSLKEYFENKDIKAILLRIDSPGGYAGSSESLYYEIMQLKKENVKPVVVYTPNLCASGAYLIACAADYIVATPSCTVGSIGAYIGYFQVKDLLKHWNIDYKLQKAGEYKAATNPFTTSTDKEEALLKQMAHDVYKNFTNVVAQSRKLSLKDVDIWANGRVFTGIQARELGLIDEVGSESNALKKIKELALIDNKIEFVKPTKPSLIERLTGQLDDEDDCDSSNTLLETVLSKVIEQKMVTKL